MVSYAERTSTCLAATLDLSWVSMEVQSLSACFQVAAVTEVSAIEAYIESDVATESTLVVDVLGAMPQNIALCLSKAEFF